MQITTKYSIGDEVWFMDNNRPVRANVGIVQTFASECAETITYKVKKLPNGNLDPVELYESKLFPSKQELLASL
jgi:hypothetical protein